MSLLTPTTAHAWLNLAPVLLHTLWQAAFIALLLGLTLALLPASRTRLRYGLSVAALAAVLAGAFLTLAVLERQPHPTQFSASNPQPTTPETSHHQAATVSPDARAGAKAIPSPSFRETTPDYRAIVLGCWLTGVFAMIGRLGMSLHAVDRLRRQSRPCPDREQLALLGELARRAGAAEHRIRLLVADHLDGPVALGVIWPAIILPASLATGTSPETLRAILAHELAHVRRHDYLVNLGQLLIETLLFFNPAVWLISRWVRIEREACCDALAARLLDDESDYAEALANYAAAHQSAPLPALAFSDAKQPSSLADRVRRLLVPGYRPRIRLPLTSLAMFILGGGLLLAALHQGSRAAVEVGARLLTPEERIEQIQQIQQTHAIKSDANYGDVTEDSPRVIIRGRVFDGAGNLVTNRDVHARAQSERPRMSSSSALNVRQGIVSDDLGPGEICIAVTRPGFAPALVGPLDGQPGASFTNLSFVLTNGVNARLKLVNPAGAALSGGRVKGVYDFGAYVRVAEATSDRHGIVTLSNALTRAAKLEVRCPGFQYDERNFPLSADTIPEWRLFPAKPAIIRVVDEAGAPVPFVRASLARISGFKNTSYGIDPATAASQLLGTGDERGVLILDHLRDDSVYDLILSAPGYQRQFVRQVYAAETNRVVRLGAPLTVSGYFMGDLSQLKQRKRRRNGKWVSVPYVSYSLGYKFGDHSTSRGSTEDVTIRDGRGYFTLTNLLPGRLKIHGPKEPFQAELTRPISDLRLELTAEAASPATTDDLPTRLVRINLRVPDGQPAARGQLHLRLNHKTADRYGRHEERAIEVTNNRVELELTIGTRIDIEPGNFTGYWFPELSGKKVETGEGAQLFTLDCVPAGAIYGSITETDGSPARSVMISVVVEEKSDLQEGFLNVDIKNSSSSSDRTKVFTATPLPLGGTYRIIAHRGPTFVLSKSIAVSMEAPVHKVALVLPEGTTISGQIVNEAGKPIPGIKYDYSFRAVAAHGFGGSDQFTDRLGRFKFERTAPADPERWFINIHDNPGYQRIRLPLKFTGDMRITLPSGRKVEGRVIDQETGWPIPGVEVYALPRPYSEDRGGHIEADGKTDEQGRFRFTTMDHGKYQLGVRAGNLPRGLEVEVIGDQSAPVTLPMSLSEWSRLKPVKPVSQPAADAR